MAQRAGQLASLMLQPRLEGLVCHLLAPETEGQVRLISVGAGPGPDAVGLSLFLEYVQASGRMKYALDGLILDKEPSWEQVVERLAEMMPGSKLQFGSSDILKPLDEESNHMLQSELSRPSLAPPVVVCNHVCVENAVALQELTIRLFLLQIHSCI